MSFRHLSILVLAVLVTSWSGPLVRLATDVPPLAIAFWRTALATSLLLPIALKQSRHELTRLSRRDWLLATSSALFLAMHFATWIASISLTTIASSVLLVTSVPLWVALATVLMGRRLPLVGWLGIGIGILGGALVTFAGAGRSSGVALGNVLALLGAITAAIYLLIGGSLRKRLSIFPYTAVVYGICAVFLLAGAFVIDAPITGFSLSSWIPIILIAAGPQLVGHTSYNYLLEHVETWKVSAAVLGEPIGATAIAMILFAEVPGILIVPGGLLLLAGVWLALNARERLPAIHPME